MCYKNLHYEFLVDDYNRTESKLILGVDVGKKGAYVVIDIDGNIIEYGFFKPYNHHRLFRVKPFWDFVEKYSDRIVCAAVEELHAYSTDGRNSAFTFGMQLGGVLAIANIFEIPVIEIAPLDWKTILFGKKQKPEWRKNKEYSIKYIQKLYPDLSLLKSKRSRKPDHNLADAICIALAIKKQIEEGKEYVRC